MCVWLTKANATSILSIDHNITVTIWHNYKRKLARKCSHLHAALSVSVELAFKQINMQNCITLHHKLQCKMLNMLYLRVAANLEQRTGKALPPWIQVPAVTACGRNAFSYRSPPLPIYTHTFAYMRINSGVWMVVITYRWLCPETFMCGEVINTH